MQGNSNYVTVVCRLKPLSQNQEKSSIDVSKTTHSITISEPSKSISKNYDFDQIFDEYTSQDKFVHYMCNPIIDFLIEGGNSGLIFSYGITNSGKTYSILGTPQNPGILLNLIKMLSKLFKNDPIRITACELYKDEFYSLKNKGEKLNPREFRGKYSLQDCQYEIINQDNMEELFSSYLHNRTVSSTIFNSHSSRSHAIFKIQNSRFKIGVVDLAGSERLTNNSNLSKNDIKDTIFINQSLLSLKRCITALQQCSSISQKIIVPYRESKLTQSLIQYFNPKSTINIIVSINQARHCLQQNLMVMDYTSKAKLIKYNPNSDFALNNKNKKYDENRKSLMKSLQKKNLPQVVNDQKFKRLYPLRQQNLLSQYIKQNIQNNKIYRQQKFEQKLRKINQIIKETKQKQQQTKLSENNLQKVDIFSQNFSNEKEQNYSQRLEKQNEIIKAPKTKLPENHLQIIEMFSQNASNGQIGKAFYKEEQIFQIFQEKRNVNFAKKLF